MIGQGVWILWGSKIVISHWQSQSPLTQGWRYRAARDIVRERQNSAARILRQMRIEMHQSERRVTDQSARFDARWGAEGSTANMQLGPL